MKTELAIPGFSEGAGKKERILRAAVDVFAVKGYFNSRVSAIAKAAGVADGTIYLYFSNKEDLLISIFRQYMRTFLGWIEEEMKAATGAEDRLRRTIHLHLRASGLDRSLAIVFQVELRHTLKFMELFTHQEFARYLNHIREVVEDGQREGQFVESIHAQLAAKAIFGMLDEMVTSWVLSDKEYRLEESAEGLAEMVLRGLKVGAVD